MNVSVRLPIPQRGRGDAEPFVALWFGLASARAPGCAQRITGAQTGAAMPGTGAITTSIP